MSGEGSFLFLTPNSGLCPLLSPECCQGNHSTWPVGGLVDSYLQRLRILVRTPRGGVTWPVFLQRFLPPTHPQDPVLTAVSGRWL